MTLRQLHVAILLIAVGATAARAHHISGKVYCDNGDMMIGTGDTPLDNVQVKVASKTVNPNDIRFDLTGDSNPIDNPGPGAYFIKLITQTDDYAVMLTGVGQPLGSNIILPVGGMYMIHIETGNDPTKNSRENVDFLLNNCGPGTTSTSTTGTTSTSTTSTSATGTTSTSTTVTTSSSTTQSTNPNEVSTTTTATTSTVTTSTSSSTTTTPGSTTTTTTVCIPTPENCTNMKDDDCDMLVDCVDVVNCNPQVPPCRILRDPTRIIFGPPGEGRDYFKSHGRVKLKAPVDPDKVEVGWNLTNAKGMIYQANVQIGDMANTGRSFYFQNNDARINNDNPRGGIYRVRVDISRRGTAYYWIKAYGDLSLATEAVMTLQLHIGDQWFGISGRFHKTTRGNWILWGRNLVEIPPSSRTVSPDGRTITLDAPEPTAE